MPYRGCIKYGPAGRSQAIHTWVNLLVSLLPCCKTKPFCQTKQNSLATSCHLEVCNVYSVKQSIETRRPAESSLSSQMEILSKYTLTYCNWMIEQVFATYDYIYIHIIYIYIVIHIIISNIYTYICISDIIK